MNALLKYGTGILLTMMLPAVQAVEVIPVDIAKFTPVGDNRKFVRIDPEVEYKSIPALLFDMPEFTAFQVTQEVTVKPNRYYLLQAVLKLNNPYIEERGYAGLHIIVSDSGGNHIASTTFLTAVSDWKPHELAFRSDKSGTMYVTFSAIEGKGQAWLGELTLTELGEDGVGNITPSDPAAAQLQDRTGLLTYQDHPEEMYYPTRVPPEPSRGDKLAFHSAGNQIAQAALGVYACEALTGLEVTLAGDLVREECTARIEADKVEIRYLKPEPYYADALRFFDYPVFLRRNQPVDIPANENRRFFFTLAVPAGTPPGIYQAPVTLRSAGQPEREVTLELEVYPFDLEDSDNTYFFYHNTAFDARIAADMARHGLNSITMYDSATMKDGRLDSRIDCFAREMRTGGLFHPQHPPLYLYCGRDGIATFAPPGQLVAPLMEAGKKAGWEDFYLYCVDEPNSSERIEEAKQAIPQLREAAPEAKITTAIGIGGLEGGLGPLYDLLILDMMAMRDLLPYVAADPGKKFWTYECRMNGKSPMADRYSFGVFNYAAGGSGCAQWIYFDPDRPGDGRKGVVYGYVLVEPDDIVPSIGYEAKREGITDARYIQMVEKLITGAKNPDSTAVRTAAATLAEIRGTVDLDSFHQRMEAMNGIEFRLDNQPQTGWEATFPDRWRERLARHIIELGNELQQ